MEHTHHRGRDYTGTTKARGSYTRPEQHRKQVQDAHQRKRARFQQEETATQKELQEESSRASHQEELSAEEVCVDPQIDDRTTASRRLGDVSATELEAEEEKRRGGEDDDDDDDDEDEGDEGEDDNVDDEVSAEAEQEDCPEQATARRHTAERQQPVNERDERAVHTAETTRSQNEVTATTEESASPVDQPHSVVTTPGLSEETFGSTESAAALIKKQHVEHEEETKQADDDKESASTSALPGAATGAMAAHKADEVDETDDTPKPGCSKRSRATWRQTRQLELAFIRQHTPNTYERSQIATQLGMPMRKIQVWFQNRRAKVRKQHKEGTLPDYLRPVAIAMDLVDEPPTLPTRIAPGPPPILMYSLHNNLQPLPYAPSHQMAQSTVTVSQPPPLYSHFYLPDSLPRQPNPEVLHHHYQPQDQQRQRQPQDQQQRFQRPQDQQQRFQQPQDQRSHQPPSQPQDQRFHQQPHHGPTYVSSHRQATQSLQQEPQSKQEHRHHHQPEQQEQDQQLHQQSEQQHVPEPPPPQQHFHFAPSPSPYLRAAAELASLGSPFPANSASSNGTQFTGSPPLSRRHAAFTYPPPGVPHAVHSYLDRTASASGDGSFSSLLAPSHHSRGAPPFVQATHPPITVHAQQASPYAIASAYPYGVNPPLPSTHPALPQDPFPHMQHQSVPPFAFQSGPIYLPRPGVFASGSSASPSDLYSGEQRFSKRWKFHSVSQSEQRKRKK